MTELKNLAKEIIMQMPEMTDVVNDPNSNESTVLVKEELLIFIESALQKVRDETIEECASLCEDVQCVDHCACRTAEELMAEILALKSKEEK